MVRILTDSGQTPKDTLNNAYLTACERLGENPNDFDTPRLMTVKKAVGRIMLSKVRGHVYPIKKSYGPTASRHRRLPTHNPLHWIPR